MVRRSAGSAPRRSTRFREGLLAYGFLAPVLVLFAAFAYYPLSRLVYLSLYQRNANAFLGGSDRWLGPGNIIDVLSGPELRAGVWVSVQFTLLTVPLGVTLGLLLAVAADRKLAGIRIFQTIFSSTVASSVAVASVVFLTLLQPETGLWRDVSWLSLNRPGSALLAVSLSAVWQNAGLTFVVVLAALQAIPDEVREATLLDGFGVVRRFFRVTVPLISPALLFLAIVLVVHALQAYAQFEILRPTDTAQPLLYKIADPDGVLPLSTRAALSLGLFVLTLVVSFTQFTLLDKRVHYGD